MTLRIRRGTEAQRTSITPASGELIYTTDTKSLYIGDDTTVGGFVAANGQGATASDVPRFERTLATTSLTAGSFVIGTSYTITFVGSTNFTLIGASENTVGVSFIATGVGTGSGTVITSGGNALHTALRLVKRVPAASNLDYDLGGPAINFFYQYGDASVAAQTVGLFGTRYQGVGTTNNHSFQFQLLSGSSGVAYDTVLNLSRLRADIDVPIKPRTFADSTAREAHYASFTEPDASPTEGDMLYLTSDNSSKPRLQVYNNAGGTGNAAWYSLLTRRFHFTDGNYGPTFAREETAAETSTSALRLIRRRTDDTTNTNDRLGPALRFDFAYGEGTGNETPFGFIGTNYKGTTGDHEMGFTTQTGATLTSHFLSSRKKFQFNVPARFDLYTTATRDSELSGNPATATLEVGMVIFNTSTTKLQVCTSIGTNPSYTATWVDLH